MTNFIEDFLTGIYLHNDALLARMAWIPKSSLHDTYGCKKFLESPTEFLPLAYGPSGGSKDPPCLGFGWSFFQKEKEANVGTFYESFLMDRLARAK